MKYRKNGGRGELSVDLFSFTSETNYHEGDVLGEDLKGLPAEGLTNMSAKMAVMPSMKMLSKYTEHQIFTYASNLGLHYGTLAIMLGKVLYVIKERFSEKYRYTIHSWGKQHAISDGTITRAKKVEYFIRHFVATEYVSEERLNSLSVKIIQLVCKACDGGDSVDYSSYGAVIEQYDNDDLKKFLVAKEVTLCIPSEEKVKSDSSLQRVSLEEFVDLMDLHPDFKSTSQSMFSAWKRLNDEIRVAGWRMILEVPDLSNNLQGELDEVGQLDG